MEMIDIFLWFYWLLITLLSLLIGKFLNIIIYFIPEFMQRQWQKEFHFFNEKNKITSIDNSRMCHYFLLGSFCLQCQKTISVKYHIPLLSLSYLFCNSVCSKKNIIRHHIIEILIAIILLFIIINFSDNLLRLSALVLIFSLTILTFIDLDTGILPDSITLPLLWSGLILNVKGLFVALDSAVLGAVSGYLFLWSIYWIFKLLTNKEGMGYGDFKMLAALGAWFGMEAVPVLILLSSAFAIFIHVIVFFKKRHHNTIAFGPFLALSGMSYFLFITLL